MFPQNTAGTPRKYRENTAGTPPEHRRNTLGKPWESLQRSSACLPGRNVKFIIYLIAK
jgi:hypothetical protein